jgi:ribokinase
LLAIGDVLVDVLASGLGHDARVRLVPGGSAANAGLAAARAGAQAVVIGRVGDDAAGRMLRAELLADGIAASLSVDGDQPTGTFLVLDGEVRVDRGANAAFAPEHLPASIEADATLVSGHLPADTVAAVLERSRAGWNAVAPARLERLPEGGNAVFLDEAEARRLLNEPPERAVPVLGERYRFAAVTCGEEGAIGILDGAVETVRPDERVASTGAFGAGDAFAAAALAALASGGMLREALVAGCRAGTLALSGPQ